MIDYPHVLWLVCIKLLNESHGLESSTGKPSSSSPSSHRRSRRRRSGRGRQLRLLVLIIIVVVEVLVVMVGFSGSRSRRKAAAQQQCSFNLAAVAVAVAAVVAAAALPCTWQVVMCKGYRRSRRDSQDQCHRRPTPASADCRSVKQTEAVLQC